MYLNDVFCILTVFFLIYNFKIYSFGLLKLITYQSFEV